MPAALQVIETSYNRIVERGRSSWPQTSNGTFETPPIVGEILHHSNARAELQQEDVVFRIGRFNEVCYRVPDAIDLVHHTATGIEQNPKTDWHALVIMKDRDLLPHSSS